MFLAFYWYKNFSRKLIYERNISFLQDRLLFPVVPHWPWPEVKDHLRGKIFRISHMGLMDNFDIAIVISALELTLKELGYSLSLGAGLKASQEELFSSL